MASEPIFRAGLPNCSGRLVAKATLTLFFLTLFFLTCTHLSQAGEVTVVKAEVKCENERCAANVTLKHDDTGWKHYANHWRVLNLQGEELGRRELAHPHVDEQPFTRGLYTLTIPIDMEYVLIEGHDLQHEYGGNRLKIKVER